MATCPPRISVLPLRCRAVAGLFACCIGSVSCTVSGDEISEVGAPPGDARAVPDGDTPTSPDGAPDPCDTVALDPAIEDEVRSSMVVPDIGPLDAETRGLIERLSVAGVVSLQGIECFPNLKDVYFARGEASDLSPLAALIRLEEVALSDHPVADVSPLSSLSNLRRLRITAGYQAVAPIPLGDIAPLRELRALEEVTLTRTLVSDLTALTGHRLARLNVGLSPVSSLEPLRGMTTLVTLEIGGTAVTDLSPIDFPPPADYEGCPEIHALHTPLDQNSVENLLPALCAMGWSVDWARPGEVGSQYCGPACGGGF